MIEVLRIPVLSDNYVWLVHEPQSGETAVIDPAVAEPVLEAARANGWNITQIWNTHWHDDHVGGNAEIKAATGCVVTGPAAERSKIAVMDRAVGEGDQVQLGDVCGEVLEVPGHTDGHVAFHLPSDAAIFVGDVLFAMGCGRLFEGQPDQMLANMRRLAALPEDTQVYCAHEYTQMNGRFALKTEPDNQAIVDRMKAVDQARLDGVPTVPTTIGMERATNPFMRAASLEEFTARRAARDVFRG